MKKKKKVYMQVLLLFTPSKLRFLRSFAHSEQLSQVTPTVSDLGFSTCPKQEKFNILDE